LGCDFTPKVTLKKKYIFILYIKIICIFVLVVALPTGKNNVNLLTYPRKPIDSSASVGFSLFKQ